MYNKKHLEEVCKFFGQRSNSDKPSRGKIGYIETAFEPKFNNYEINDRAYYECVTRPELELNIVKNWETRMANAD